MVRADAFEGAELSRNVEDIQGMVDTVINEGGIEFPAQFVEDKGFGCLVVHVSDGEGGAAPGYYRGAAGQLFTFIQEEHTVRHEFEFFEGLGDFSNFFG